MTVVGLVCVHPMPTFTPTIFIQGTQLSSWPAYITRPPDRGASRLVSVRVPPVKKMHVLSVVPSHVDLCSQQDTVEITAHDYEDVSPYTLLSWIARKGNKLPCCRDTQAVPWQRIEASRQQAAPTC